LRSSSLLHLQNAREPGPGRQRKIGQGKLERLARAPAAGRDEEENNLGKKEMENEVDLLLLSQSSFLFSAVID
jgi:hypothetical protein